MQLVEKHYQTTNTKRKTVRKSKSTLKQGCSYQRRWQLSNHETSLLANSIWDHCIPPSWISSAIATIQIQFFFLFKRSQLGLAIRGSPGLLLAGRLISDVGRKKKKKPFPLFSNSVAGAYELKWQNTGYQKERHTTFINICLIVCAHGISQ